MCWTRHHYHPRSNLGVGISEGGFIFDFASLPLEVAYHVHKSGRKTPIIIIISRLDTDDEYLARLRYPILATLCCCKTTCHKIEPIYTDDPPIGRNTEPASTTAPPNLHPSAGYEDSRTYFRRPSLFNNHSSRSPIDLTSLPINVPILVRVVHVR